MPDHLDLWRARLVTTSVTTVAALSLFLPLSACRQATGPASPVDPGSAQTAAGGEPEVPQDGPGTSSPALPGSAALATERILAALPQVESVWGIAGSADGQLMLPVGVAVDEEGNVYVSDSTGAQKFTADGRFVARFGAGDLKTALGGLAVADDGRVYVTGYDAQLHVFGQDGGRLATVGTVGSDPGQLAKPVDVALDAAGNAYVADVANARIEVFSPDGDHLRTIGERGEGRGQFRTPRAVAVDAQGNVYVGQGDDFLMQVFSPDGTYLQTFGDSQSSDNIWRIGGIAVDDDGNVYVTQAMSNRIQAYAPWPDLGLEWDAGALGTGREEVSTPLGIEYADGRLFVADQLNNRIKVYRLAP